MKPQEKAAAIIAARPLPALVNDWEVLDKKPLDDRVITVRGWLLDEFERRNFDAFAKWIDCGDDSPRSFFLT